jgi:hypothetical protein
VKGNSYWSDKQNKQIQGKAQIMVGINGFHAIANSHQLYDGLEVGMIGKGGEYLPLTYPTNDYIGAWCKVYRKDRRIPVEGVAFMAEYGKGKVDAKYDSVWKSMPRVMIQKCAESVALRKAFPQELNGVYSDAEMPLEYSQPTATVVPPQLQSVVKPADEIDQSNYEEDDIPESFSTVVKKNEGEPQLGYIYDLNDYPFRDVAHMDELLQSLKTKLKVTVIDVLIIESPKVINTLKDYQISAKDWLAMQEAA